MTRIAIHGFGRIGRATLKAALRDGSFTPVAIGLPNKPTPTGNFIFSCAETEPQTNAKAMKTNGNSLVPRFLFVMAHSVTHRGKISYPHVPVEHPVNLR